MGRQLKEISKTREKVNEFSSLEYQERRDMKEEINAESWAG